MLVPNALLRCARLAATFDAGEGVFGISSAEVSFLCVVALRGGVRENLIWDLNAMVHNHFEVLGLTWRRIYY